MSELKFSPKLGSGFADGKQMSMVHEPVDMTFSQAVAARRSVRGFLDRRVEMAKIEAVFDLARLAPSNCNVQPWIVHVVSGEAAQAMRSALSEAAQAGEELDPGVPLSPAYPAPWRARQIDAAVRLFSAEGIERADSEGRRRSYLRNFRFFDAPHAAFIFMPGWAGLREAADCGMYAQTLMLAMAANGIASCPQGTLSHFASVVSSQLGVADDAQLLFGIAFGYEDTTHRTAMMRIDRASLLESVRFHD